MPPNKVPRKQTKLDTISNNSSLMKKKKDTINDIKKVYNNSYNFVDTEEDLEMIEDALEDEAISDDDLSSLLL